MGRWLERIGITLVALALAIAAGLASSAFGAEQEEASPKPTQMTPEASADVATSAEGDRETAEYMAFAQERLKKQVEALRAIHEEMKASAQRMEKLRAEIDERSRERRDFEEKKIQELAQIYGLMKPAEVAKVLVKVEPRIRYEVLARLDPKKVSRILVELPPDEAAEATQKLLESRGPVR